MPRKNRSRVRWRRRLAQLWCGWVNVRFYWHTAPKLGWFLASLIVSVVGLLGYLVHSMIVRQDDIKSLTCLAFNVYFEARGEPLDGQYAVAEVTMNRVASRRYPDTVCGVVHQRRWDPLRQRYVSAFSWNELDERPSLEDDTFRRAWQVAETVYYGRHTPRVAGALHYHAVYVKPSWSRNNRPVARIGQHIFYK